MLISQDGYVGVKIWDGKQDPTGAELRVNCRELKVADIAVKHKVKVISGHRAGLIGFVSVSFIDQYMIVYKYFFVLCILIILFLY